MLVAGEQESGLPIETVISDALLQTERMFTLNKKSTTTPSKAK